ncbi:hypothetical protein SNEBB_001542 [Seison nebaliae]|nr:hypothetical protein SNEBB_001542 [Seison nebaliae]
MDHETNYLATSPNYSADIDDILQYDIWSTPDNESFKPFSFNPPSFLPSSSPSWTLYPSNTLFSPCQEISSPSLSSSLALSPYQPPDISASFWKPSPGLSSLITNEKEEKRNKWIEYMYNQLNKNNMEIKKLLDSEYHEQFKETLPPQLLQITYEILKDDFQKRHNTLTTEPNDNSSEDEMQLKLNNFNCLIQASRRKSLEHGEQIFSYRKNGKMIDAIKEFQLNDTLIRQRFFMKHVQKILKEQAIFRPIDSDAINRISKWMNDEFLNVRLELRKKFSTLLIQYNMERTDRRKLRRNFSHNVTQLLNKSFRRSAYPSEKTKRELADQCGISVAQVSNWFGNKRIRCKNNHGSTSREWSLSMCR